MPSEKRGTTGARFYYRAKRTGSRVVKDYVGSLADPVVAFLARQDRLSKAERLAQNEADVEEHRAYDAIEAYLTALDHQLGQVLRRWKRCPTSRSNIGRKKGVRSMDSKQHRQPLTRDEFDEVVKRAELGDADALDDLRALMRADPATWRRFGDLTEHVKRTFLGLMVQGNVVARESLTLQLDELTRELRQGHQSTMIRLVIDQILILWLDVHYQQTMAAEPGQGKMDVDFLDRRLAKARKRYFAALESLGKMERILGLRPTPAAEKPERTASKAPSAPSHRSVAPTMIPQPCHGQNDTPAVGDGPTPIRSDAPPAATRPSVIPTMIPPQPGPELDGTHADGGGPMAFCRTFLGGNASLAPSKTKERPATP